MTVCVRVFVQRSAGDMFVHECMCCVVCGLLADSSQPAPVVQGLSMTGWGNMCFCGLVYWL